MSFFNIVKLIKSRFDVFDACDKALEQENEAVRSSERLERL